MIVGITGYARSGKDTVADYLVRKHAFRKVSFADPLKRVCQIAFGFTNEQVYGEEKNAITVYDETPRAFLQFVGTDLFRYGIARRFPTLGSDVWIECMKRTIAADPNARWVIPDVRFRNEADFVRNAGGTVVRVVRPAVVQEKHASEMEQDDIRDAWCFVNDGRRNDLYQQIDEALPCIFGQAETVNARKSPC